MWKAQMLTGMQPTWFSGKPVDFPSFVMKFLRTSKAQLVEYVPTFVTEEALEVAKRNTGCVVTNLKRIVSCLPNDLIIKWQKENFGTVEVIAQICIAHPFCARFSRH